MPDDGAYTPADPDDPGSQDGDLYAAEAERDHNMQVYADNRMAGVRWRARRLGVALLRLLVRLLKSTPRLIAWPFRGAGITVTTIYVWLTLQDDYGQTLRDDPTMTKEYVRLRKTRAFWGRWTALTALLGTAALQIYLYFTGRDASVVYTGWAVVLLIIFLIMGAHDWQVLAEPVELAWASPGDEFVRQAFPAAGLAKDEDEVKLLTPVRSDGDGWRVRVRLRRGRTFAQVVAAQDSLASALGTSAERLWLRGVAGDNSVVDLHVSNREPFSDEDTRHPLAENPRRVSSWDQVELGLDIRMVIVRVLLAGMTMLIGGMPRLGKTTAAHNVIIHFLLDPHSPIYLADGKGLDSAPYEDLCEEIGDAGNPTTMVMALRRANEEMRRRQQLLREHGLVKLGRADAERLGLGLALLWVDELTTFTQHPDVTLRKEMLQLIGDLVRIGPTVGFFVLLAAHKPSNEVIKSDISDLIPLRWALYCSSWRMSDAVLGAGQAKLGLGAHRLPMKPGATILVAGAGHDAKMRPHNVRPQDIGRVAAVARRLRQEAGTLPARLTAVAGQPPLLLAMQAAMTAGDGVAALPTATLLDILASIDAVAYGGWTGDRLAEELRQYKFGPRQLGRHSPVVDGRPTNWRGYFLEDVEKALREWRG